MLISKRYKEANKAVKKAKRAIQIFENKRKRELKVQGIQVHKDKKAQIARLREIAPQEFIPLEVEIPPEIFYPIRDPKKEPFPSKVKALMIYPNLD